MLLHIPDILSAEEVTACRQALQAADWVDGRGTAGHLSKPAKHNRQLHWQHPVSVHWGSEITARLEKNLMFLSAALPHAILPPLFNRYEDGGHYGPHLDGAIRSVDGTRERIRTDLSLTLSLSDPDTYDGGELVITDTFGDRSVKLPAGDAILYPGTSIHHVTPVRRGIRFAAFTWIQSMVREDGDRALLFNLDTAIQHLPGNMAADQLRFANIYHNLLRRWADL